jgi:ATP-dependent helicase/nuclease subunit B
MGSQSGALIDAWLRDGGVVIASSDRAARALRTEFHRRRRVEGLAAWPAPAISDWHAFVLSAWQEMASDSRLVLNSAQEQQIWSDIIRSDEQLATVLPASVRRLAAMAMEAHDLLCSYASRYLKESTRAGWELDAGAFSKWLSRFDEHCRKNQLISRSRLPLELIPLLEKDNSTRPPLQLAGFDRILPLQQSVLDAWGSFQNPADAASNAQIDFFSVPDTQSELEVCAWWCYQQIEKAPGSRLLVITQELAQRRGEIERAFLRFNPATSSPLFEFSLGSPVGQMPLVRSALLLLRWLSGSLTENELDWLFASGYASTAEEAATLQAGMRRLRYRDRQRIEWTPEGLHGELTGDASAAPRWARRLREAQSALKRSERSQTAIDWADKVPRLLEDMGWPNMPSPTSTEFQILRRWQSVLDVVGSLGFSGQRVSWHAFLTELEAQAAETLFAPESSDAPIQIIGPAESAGLSADAIWFLGAQEDSWPADASSHPFLPSNIQRETAMPHSSHAYDWKFSLAITQRLISSASAVHFSFPMQKDDVETRPSRLVAQIAGAPQPSPAELTPPHHEPSQAAEFPDSSRVAYELPSLRGGAGVLSSQSQCAFKAFAGSRLAAQSWDAAEAGLSAKQRGQILHDVLHSVWSGKKPGIRTSQELLEIGDLAAFVRVHVKRTLESKVPPAVRDLMPKMYLELEETRLIRLVTEWLDFERTRLPFTVEQTEAERIVTISELSMKLRLDRVDRLHDGSLLVVDYKTGNPDSKSWDLPRPDDVQLPLYKIFGLEPLQPSLFDSVSGPVTGGLVFAKVRAGKACFEGRVADALATINPGLSGNSNLVKRKLTAHEEAEWKGAIEKLVYDFVHGRAEVDPRDYPKTCEYCGLQAVCRVQEPANRRRFEKEESETDDDAEE